MDKLYLITGHGAGDPGAVGGGQTEEENVRRLAKRIKELGGDRVVLLDMSRNWYADKGVNSLDVPKGSWLLELHRDSANGSARGAHVIIKKGIGGADKYDKALANALAAIFPGRSSIIVERSDLANANRASARGINYRLAEVGFIDNETDRHIFDTRLDEIATAILKAFDTPVNGGASTPTPAPAPSKPAAPAPSPAKPSTSSNFGGTYKVNCDVLNVRSGPGTGYPVKTTYRRGQTVVLDNWYKSADGYIWGRYTGASSGQLRYVAVGKATGKPEPNDYLVKI